MEAASSSTSSSPSYPSYSWREELSARFSRLHNQLTRGVQPRNEEVTCRLGEGRVSYISRSSSTHAEIHARLLSGSSNPEFASSGTSGLSGAESGFEQNSPKSSHPAAKFDGYMKVNIGEGRVTEGSVLLPNDSGNKRKERRSLAVRFNHDSSILLHQITSFFAIVRSSLKQLDLCTDAIRKNANLAYDEILEMMLAIETKLKAALKELSEGCDLGRLLHSGRGGCSPSIHPQHPFRSQVPSSAFVEIGIKDTCLCVYVLSLSMNTGTTGSKLVENMIEATGSASIFRGMLKDNKSEESKIMSQVSSPDMGIGYSLYKVTMPNSATSDDNHGATDGDSFQGRTVVSFSQCSCKLKPLSDRRDAVEKALKLVQDIYTFCQQARIAGAVL